MRIAVVCMQWGIRYTADHVERLRDLVAANFSRPYRFVCVSDHPAAIRERGIDCIRLPPHAANLPRTYPKLWLFSTDFAHEVQADRLLFLDLDVTILRDLAPLLGRPHPLVMLPEFVVGERFGRFNSSVMLMTPGHNSHIWAKFSPERDILAATASGKVGDDQIWIDWQLGRWVPKFSILDGIRSYKFDYLPNGPRPLDRLIVFHGKPKPWDCDNLSHPDA